MEGTIAEIRLFAGNFNPRGWAFCSGSLLSIAQNTALFSLVGTTYGGNGQTTFALPDFRGRIGVGTGNGAGLPSVTLGEMSGFPTTTLLSINLPAHTHTLSGGLTPQASNTGASSSDPTSKFVGKGSFYAPAGDNISMAQIPATGLQTSAAGSNSPVSVMQPYLGLNFIICVEGIYPSRN
ncbi:MAG: tail fiber protein [Spirosomaceae bacterium]|jgi:microcystin-dependent protein|nr:tail fiber protein [Spirosomataceae bacterium]